MAARRPLSPLAARLAIVCAASIAAGAAPADGWRVLVGPESGLAAWKSPTGAWAEVKDVALDPSDDRHLATTAAGTGVIVNDPPGRTTNLVSRERFGDVEVHLEFAVPKGSNSGIKLMGLYEVQIHDSHGVATPTASDNGGVYPRAELLPRYHHIDQGYPPRLNASKAPGEWQELDIVFRAPKFDAAGKKTANARFEKVVLNGQTIHEGLELPSPTGARLCLPEVADGPIFLQADHGPVAFRNVRVRPL